MITPPMPPNEGPRLAALRYLEILDSAPDQEFDAIVQAAAVACGVPVAAISLVDESRQWIKAQTGSTTVRNVPRDISFCAHAILEAGIFEVPDALDDPRFALNPLVTGADEIRFYAGTPLATEAGCRLGTLCIIDHEPRRLTGTQREVLLYLGLAAASAMQSWSLRKKQKAIAHALDHERQRMANLIAGTDVGTWEWNVQTGEYRVNERWAQLFGLSEADVDRLTFDVRLKMTHPDDISGLEEKLAWHLSGQTGHYEHEFRMRHRDGHFVWVWGRGTVMVRLPDGKPEWMFGFIKDISARKAQETAHRKSEELLERTGWVAGIGGWELDLATKEITWSAQTRKLHGVAPDYTPSLEEALAFFPPEAITLIDPAIERACRGEGGWDLELPFVPADGRRIWVRSVGSAVYVDGRPARLIGAIQDVTDRILQRRALEDANTRVTLATENAGIGIWEWRAATDEFLWNDRNLQLHGRTPAATAPCFSEWLKSLHPEDRPDVEQALIRALDGRAAFDTEFRVIWGDGSVHYLRSIARVAAANRSQTYTMVGANWDVTETRLLAAERDRQDAKLAAREADFRLLAENANDMISRVEADGTRSYVSPASARIFGKPPQALIESGAMAMVHPDDQSVLSDMQRNLLSGTAEQAACIFRVLHPKRGEVWAEVSARALSRTQPTLPTGYISVTRDVTERVRLEAEREQRGHELSAANAELEKMARHLVRARDTADRANRAKSRFLAGMSHELRTPLNGILGYAELLRLEGGLNAVQAERVDAMLGAGTHLLDMISSVLELSEIEAERIELRPSEVDLRKLAATSLELVRPRAEAKGLRLAVEAEPDGSLCLITDQLRLRQVLLNLLGNAVKFTECGGVVMRLFTLTGANGLRIEIVDSGPGIAPGPRARLFQDFTRLQPEITGECEGAGLGLALSSRLVKLMGGRLGHDHNPDGGSIFWLELPPNMVSSNPAPAHLRVATAPEPLVQAGPCSRNDERASTLRVLVVDDIAMNREIAGSFLRMVGHDVRYAAGGAEAVAAAIIGDIDVILMDVRMPDVDGFEATRRIRALGNERSKVAILGLTAQAFSDQVTDCLQAGMNSHLAKPYTAAALQEAVLETAALNRGGAKTPHGTDARSSAPHEMQNALPLRDRKTVHFVSG